MNKFSGKFERLHEETLFRYQQGGFLRGDYAKIKKDALKNESVKQFSDQMKETLQDAIKNDTVLRVSYIKSGKSEAMSGPVDAPNIPGELWADCYVEHAPGMWHNVMTLPLSVLEKQELDGANGFVPYNKDLVRPNAEEPDKADKELKSQTKGDDDNRNLSDKNTKLANTKEPKDGRDQTKFKESVGFHGENDLMFETYTKTQPLVKINKEVVVEAKTEVVTEKAEKAPVGTESYLGGLKAMDEAESKVSPTSTAKYLS